MPKAKKDYCCDLCCQPIPAGTDYFRYNGVPWENPEDPVFYRLRYHIPCEAIVQEMMKDGDDWTIEDLQEEYRERFCPPHQAAQDTTQLPLALT